MFRRLWWQHPSLHRTKGPARKPIPGTAPPSPGAHAIPPRKAIFGPPWGPGALQSRFARSASPAQGACAPEQTDATPGRVSACHAGHSPGGTVAGPVLFGTHSWGTQNMIQRSFIGACNTVAVIWQCMVPLQMASADQVPRRLPTKAWTPSQAPLKCRLSSCCIGFVQRLDHESGADGMSYFGNAKAIGIVQ